MKAIFLRVAAVALLLAGTPALAQVSGKVEAVSGDGNEFTVEGRRVRVDDNRTDVKAGMQCKVEIARGEPRRVRMSGALATARA